MRHLPVRLSILVVLVAVTLGASSMAPAQPQVTEVLIGSVLPLTGTFASYGQQYLWSAQTAEDIVKTTTRICRCRSAQAKASLGSAARPSSSSCATTRAA